MYTLDTNAIIYYLKDDSSAVATLREIFAEPITLYVSAITEVELFGFPNLTTSEATRIEEILQTVSVIALDSHVARIAGSLRRLYV
ncbi:PIN domain-containing protein [Candidatus Parcubacteria bacterium]|nr:PIN domain-containing protein [Candidatus Parcubacteria bacterium]